MSREIKFRCKNKIGKWCFFTILHNGNVNDENFDLETLSEFTGLMDKQGVEIYEGDIVKNSFDEENYEVRFKNCSYIVYSDEQFIFPNSLYHHIKENDIEVIGNIYEHSHLLEGN